MLTNYIIYEPYAGMEVDHAAQRLMNPPYSRCRIDYNKSDKHKENINRYDFKRFCTSKIIDPLTFETCYEFYSAKELALINIDKILLNKLWYIKPDKIYKRPKFKEKQITYLYILINDDIIKIREIDKEYLNVFVYEVFNTFEDAKIYLINEIEEDIDYRIKHKNTEQYIIDYLCVLLEQNKKHLKEPNALDIYEISNYKHINKGCGR